MIISSIDHIKGIIAQAIVEGLTIDDLWECIEHAETIEAFDSAVNLLATMQKRD